MSKESIMKTHCNHCSDKTNHHILHEEKTAWSEEFDEHSSIYGGEKYILLKCAGCDNVKLLRQSWFSEATDEDGDYVIDETSYPPATDRRRPDWLSEITEIFDFDEQSENHAIKGMLLEVYVACQNDQRRLAILGVRALLEHIMIMKVGELKTFKDKLDKFLEERYISMSQKNVLDHVLEAGHAAMHRFYNPSKKDLKIVVDIMENIIQTVFIHEKAAVSVAKRVPARTKKAVAAPVNGSQAALPPPSDK
jgi:hypothetical protein